MTGRIKLLPDSVANQIAAGEVVNRPASVVKELLENAVDAGAGAVTLNFRDGGRELIQIKDDGCGMSPQDARMAFERHATSKIASVDDIYALHTFGFRGEALASIAAVAQVELQTRPEGDELGTKLNIDGGVFAGQMPAAAPKGTQIWIRNLFYNVPARKKFLDKSSSEAAHIMTEFQRVALAHPDVAFQLYRDDAPVYNLPAAGLHRRVVGIVGRGAAPKLLEVSVETSIARVYGYVGRPESARQRNKEQFMFVNGRFFKSPFFHRAILQAYEKLIPVTVQPSYFLYLEIDPEQIDVNVHPQKTEVKFVDKTAVYQIINAALRETLAKSGAVPMMDFDGDERLEIPVLGGHAGFGGRAGVDAGFGRDAAGLGFGRDAAGGGFGLVSDSGGREWDGAGIDQGGRVPVSGNTIHADGRGGYPAGGFREPATVLSGDYNPFVKYAGADDFDGRSGDYGAFDYSHPESAIQSMAFGDGPDVFTSAVNLGGGYAAAFYGRRFVAVDLRRAREAVLFDRFRRTIKSGRSATQRLLFPERMALSAEDGELLRDNESEFSAFGFDIRLAGGDSSAEIAGVPADISSERLDEVVYGMLDALREGIFTGEGAAEKRREKVAAAMARAAAGNGSTRPSQEELDALLTALAAVGNPTFTPAGRAVMAEITLDDIKYKLR